MVESWGAEPVGPAGPRESEERTERWSARWNALAEEVRRRLGPGAALRPGARRFFEGQLGGDLGAVMVHRGPFAGYLAYEAGAAAATVQGHVFGASSQLDEDTPEGAALLGHELVHAYADTRTGSLDEGPGGIEFGTPGLGGPSTRSAPLIQRAPLDSGSGSEDKEEEFARAMEESVGQIVADIEADRERDLEERGRPRPPINVTAVAERVYQRIVDEILASRERAAW